MTHIIKDSKSIYNGAEFPEEAPGPSPKRFRLIHIL